MKPQYGYQQPVIKAGDYIFGDGLLGDLPINTSGQWDSWLPDDEMQNRGFETFACVSESVLHCTEILGRKEFGDTTQYSVRYLATQSGTGAQQGNNDGTVAETLRKGGCCQESDWPFGAASYQDFYTPPPQNIVKLAGYQFRDNSFGHSWVTNTSPQSMMNALMYSPLALGVFAWPEPDADGIYHRPPGAQDCHEITVYGYVEGQYWKIFDSYDSTHKKLAWDYGFGMGKRFTLNRVIPTSPTPDNTGWVNWRVWIQVVRHFLGLEGASFGAARSPKWEQVRKAFVATHPTCAVCGTKGTLINQLNVHHIRPFHLHPELELDNSNLITLCRVHHYLFGHFDNWSSFNKDVESDSSLWASRIASRP